MSTMAPISKVIEFLIVATCITWIYGCEVPVPAGSPSVKCVSKTQFVMNFQDPVADTPLTCPAGTVCADDLSICSATAAPACKNSVAGSDKMCNECDLGVTTTSNVCVNSTAFGFCINGKLSPSMVYPCSGSTPYCKISANGVCVAGSKSLDCPLSS